MELLAIKQKGWLTSCLLGIMWPYILLDLLATLSRRLGLVVKAHLVFASIGMVAASGAHAQGMKGIKPVAASPQEMLVYRSTFGGDACAALSSGVDFEKAVVPPIRNTSFVIAILHGGLIPGVSKKLTDKQILTVANNIVVPATAQFCPEYVPAEVKSELQKTFKKLIQKK